PVATVAINGGANAALLAAQILSVEDESIRVLLDEKRRKDAEKVLEKDRLLQEELNSKN
ncbi:MAG: AIR carboxylase family protein, partial [Spirochaetales bacterium]|nr:AIR carboxylase family protein [Spirochaetales bacterium]